MRIHGMKMLTGAGATVLTCLGCGPTVLTVGEASAGSSGSGVVDASGGSSSGPVGSTSGGSSTQAVGSDTTGGIGGLWTGSGGHGGSIDRGSGGLGTTTSYDVSASVSSWLDSCPAPVAGSWVPRVLPTGDLNALRADMASVQMQMVGHWRGQVTTPWVPVYQVAIEFSADGAYAAQDLDASFPAFYYGADADSPLKQFRLLDEHTPGSLSGQIDVVFAVDELPSWQGLLDSLDIDLSSNQLRFDFSRNDGYGPVHFELARCAP